MGRSLSFNRKQTEGLLAVLWLIKMSYSSSLVFLYILIGLLGMYSMRQNTAKNYVLKGWRNTIAVAFSVLFSLSSVLSNYILFYHWIKVYNWIQKIVVLPIVLCGGICLAHNIVVWCFYTVSAWIDSRTRLCSGTKTARIFWCVFASIIAIDFLFFFGSEYPGTVTPDSLSQIEQALIGNYSNHHPFWHTVIIQFWLTTGYRLFGNYNDGVALYAVWQILFIATCFSYSVATLYQARFPKAVVICVWAIYLFMPYHIAYSFTMWKDVVFGGAVLVFTVSFYRILKKIGKYQAVNYFVFLLSGIAFGIWRTNGWIASIGAFVVSFLFLKKDHKRMILLWAVSLIVSWWMRGPALERMNIPQPDLVESLSIPVQQVARVIYEGKELESYEIELLNRIVDIEEIPSLYDSGISDPIKNEIRDKNNVYFETHIGEYLKLWVKIGLRYPGKYVNAWVDQTKGYWNGGYDYWVMMSDIYENDVGIHKVKTENLFLRDLLYQSCNSIDLNIFFCIGFHVWIVALSAVINALRQKRETLVSIPVLLVVCTLLIATPVFSEFRYAYSVFTTIPLIVATTIWSGETKKELA